MSDDQAKDIKRELAELYALRFKADVQFSMMGVRGLVNATNNAQIKVSLTNHIGKPSTNNSAYDPLATYKKREKRENRKNEKDFDSDGEDGSKIMTMKENTKFGDNQPTKNPNFGKITILKNTELA